MAIVKVLFRRNAEGVIRYVFGHTQPGDPTDSEYCPSHADGAVEDFKMIRDMNQFKEGRHEVVHVVQSWNAEESKKLSPETINAMGKSLVSDYFPGHQFVVVTHTETGKFHNHIVVNRVNLETEKLIPNRFRHLHELRKINDKLCLEKGLSIPTPDPNARRVRVPQKVQQMMQSGRNSYIWDIKNKADVARFLATSHDQYVNYLDALGIQARVEEKNITYFYPGRSRGKRGDKLGPNYDKQGLEAQYKRNDERFRENPEMAKILLAGHKYFKDRPGHSPIEASKTLSVAGLPTQELPKNYSQYTKQSRDTFRRVPASERELPHSNLHADEIRRAKRSIVDYCLANNIALASNSKGQTVLKGKDYVVIHGNEATNTRNGTKANLIDFCAAHHRLTLLQAVAKINGNDDFLEIEKHFGSVERKFTSFYFPKSDQMSMLAATEHVGKFLRAHKINTRHANELLQHQRAEVSQKGVIRFFADSDSGGVLEFFEGQGCTWTEKKRGIFQKPFYQRSTKGGRLTLFTDPKAYLASKSSQLFSDRGGRDGVLVLMEPSTALVENYLNHNSGIKSIDVVNAHGKASTVGELDFFGVLKKHFQNHHLEINAISHERVLSRESPGLSL